ncbi:sensor domain-containing diguanylate cyclase [Cucumibacter marinus]|uniref:sensor domain-containing diguanylate cyclase n=1 Tax=Cucumibacter marinus TaxID=1121252 RepID=UPI000418E5AD|nr:sensor domain-containing diguanylate cyclase [Cucumibacter marinus]
MDNFDFFDEDASGISTAILTQKSLVDTEDKLGSMLDVMPIGLLFHTEQGILYANREACRLLAVTKSGLFGQHLMDFVRDGEVDKTSSEFRAAFLGEGETCEHESVIRGQDGKERLVKIIAGKLPWEGTPVIQVLFQDITDQKRAENSLRKLTITDELTGAYNRRHVFYEAELYIGDDGKNSVPLSVILTDIDHFKAINDNYGHAVGDIALREITRHAQHFVPTLSGADSALFARVGGEEFLILLPGFEIEAAERVAEQFRRGVGGLEIPLPCSDTPLGFTVSSGVAEYRTNDRNLDGLLSRADKALYAAKSEGRNRVAIAR